MAAEIRIYEIGSSWALMPSSHGFFVNNGNVNLYVQQQSSGVPGANDAGARIRPGGSFFVSHELYKITYLRTLSGTTTIANYEDRNNGAGSASIVDPASGNHVIINAAGQITAVLNPADAVTVMDYAHYQIHKGRHYTVKNTALIGKGAAKDILMITPDSAIRVHAVVGVEATSSSVNVSFYEDTKTSANGDIDGARNRNRNIADANTALVYEDPTVTDVGDLIWAASLGAGRNNGGSDRDNEEFVLKANTKYLLRITEDDIVATDINWNLDWYEFTY